MTIVMGIVINIVIVISSYCYSYIYSAVCVFHLYLTFDLCCRVRKMDGSTSAVKVTRWF